VRAAVAVVGRDAGQGSGLAATELPEFRQFSQDRGGRHWPDAFDLLQPRALTFERVVPIDLRRDQGVHLLDLFL